MFAWVRGDYGLLRKSCLFLVSRSRDSVFGFGGSGLICRKWCSRKSTLGSENTVWGFRYSGLEIPVTGKVGIGKNGDSGSQ